MTAHEDPHRIELARRLLAAEREASAATTLSPADVGLQTVLDDAEFEAFETYAAVQMTEAGQHLVQAFRQMLADEQVWRKLGSNPRGAGISRRSRAQLLELIGLDLHLLLDHLGYKPPPPASAWVERVQEPLRRLIECWPDCEPWGGRKAAAEAEYSLRLLVLRLDWLLQRQLTVAEAGASTEDRHKARDALHRGLVEATKYAVPAAMAAGVAAGVIALTGSTGGAGLAAAGAFGAESLTKVIELAGTKLMALIPEKGAVDARDAVRLDLRAVEECLAASGDHWDVRTYFLLRRAVFQTVQDAGDLFGIPEIRQTNRWAAEVLVWAQDDRPLLELQSKTRELRETLELLWEEHGATRESSDAAKKQTRPRAARDAADVIGAAKTSGTVIGARTAEQGEEQEQNYRSQGESR